MISDQRNRNEYSEEYDMVALDELAKMAMRYVACEDDDYRKIFKTYGKTVPDGSYSDFSCNVWELMTKLVRYGAVLEKIKNRRVDYGMADSACEYMNLWYLGFGKDQRVYLRE